MRKCSGDFHKDSVFLLLPCNCPQCSLIELSHSFHWELLPNYTLRYVANTLHIDTVYIRKKDLTFNVIHAVVFTFIRRKTIAVKALMMVSCH